MKCDGFLKLRRYILLRRDSLIFMERLDKITLIVKAAGDGSLFYGNILRGEHLAGAFDSVIVQVINGRPLRHAPEISAEISGIHSRDFRQGVQGDIAVIIF